MNAVRHNIVEGEPGIFPEPVARVMRKIGELFGAKRRGTPEAEPTREPAAEAEPAPETEPTREPAAEGPSDPSEDDQPPSDRRP
jgi:hypothetical protein